MRSDRYEREDFEKRRTVERRAARKAERKARKKREKPDKTRPGKFLIGFTKFWGILYIILLLALECLLIIVNILPPVVIIITIVVLTILSLLIVPRLLFRNTKTINNYGCMLI